MNVSLSEMLKNDFDSNEQTLVDDIKILRVQYLKKSNKLRVIIKSFENTDDYKKLHNRFEIIFFISSFL